jgi:hypothetical protein
MDYPRSSAGGVDWAAASVQLCSAYRGFDVDDLIDALTEVVLAGGVGTEAAPFLTEAVCQACSDLSLRSAALALAVTAPADDAGAVDALVAAYGRGEDRVFLAPALLEALAVLALRSPLARAHVSALLLRLRPNDSRYMLVKAAKVIGRLDAVRPDSDLRAKLDEFVAGQDLAVQAEARQQLALAGLADVLLSGDRTALRERLAGARAAFFRAESSEEHRPDAAMFVRLLDMLLAFLTLNQDRQAIAARVSELGRMLDHTLTSLAQHDWHGYRSDKGTLQVQQVLRIADALRRAAESASVAEEWVNFAAALEELARLHAQIRGELVMPLDEGRTHAGLSGIADTVFAASLGPLLVHVVQQRRLSRITADYVLARGEDAIAQGLRALEQAAATAFVGGTAIPEGVMGQIAILAERLGCRPETLLTKFLEAAQEGRVARWAEEIGLGTGPLPIERPNLYDDDPTVDEVVRPLLHRIADQLGNYPPAKWARLVAVLVSLVKFAHYVRDRMPAYVVCEEDGGLGQRASEGDLQDHLFEWLRQNFGPAAVYEFARMGGGRPDTGVVFPEARFPVEAKHEFDSIDPEHVHTNFVLQADVYASAADLVSFLMILDLRASNASGHRERAKAIRRADSVAVAGLYPLRDSFRVESLPTDHDIPNATRKVVVVGFVPGNRPLPSSMSTYSRRPASARRKRDPGAIHPRTTKGSPR